jgi:hypothetical protein
VINSKTIITFVLGGLAASAGAAFVLLVFAGLGMAPVRADVAPSRLEAKLLGSVLPAAVARNAPSVPSPLPASDENLMAGAKLYREMYARCHGASKNPENAWPILLSSGSTTPVDWNLLYRP